MTIAYNRRTTGLFENGAAQKGNTDKFAFWNSIRTTSGDYLSNGGSFFMNQNRYGSGLTGSQYIPVDTSKVYQLAYSVKTITQSYNNRNASGHLGYITYDENKNFIELRNCKGLGDTTLTRAASPGDTTIYVADASGWSGSTSSHQRGIMLFGGNYPYSGGYTRYTTMTNAYASSSSLTNLGGGEWSVALTSGLATWSDLLDSNNQYPVGTYLSNGRAGGTYNYAMGAPVYPQTWPTYSAICTGETRGSGATFRHGTKFIRFMQLSNYNYRTETAGDSARYVMDNLFFGEIPSSNDQLPTSFLQSDRFK